LQVFDAEGKDVTPQPLFPSDPSAGKGKLLASRTCLGAPGSAQLSSFSLHPASGMNASVGSSSGINWSDLLTSPHSSDVQMRQEEREEELTEEDLDRRVDIYLTETATLWIMDMPSVVVSSEAEDAGRVLERNKLYVERCRSRGGNDGFVDKGMQTLSGASKSKDAQCDTVSRAEKGVMVTSWDLYDSLKGAEVEALSKAEGRRAMTGKSSRAKEHDQTPSVSCDTGSTISSLKTWESAALSRSQKEEESHAEAILTSAKLQQDLFYMERILMENIFQPKLAAYRQLPVLRDTNGTAAPMGEAEQEEDGKEKEDTEEQTEASVNPAAVSHLSETPEEIAPPGLELLWSYRCDLTSGQNVSSMAWNKVNPDLLAVGYGAFDFREQRKGLACCWSLKNPMWPERVFQCEHGITALDFSLASPNLLAVGMYDGSVSICDVRNCATTALLESSDSSNKHTAAVWQLKWLEQDRGGKGGGKKERLLCISADGRITEWLIQRRLDCTDLMAIKRIGSEEKMKTFPGEKERKSEALISPRAPGMCFDFHPKDTTIYLAGTEEGHIHRCSSLHSAQFLGTYRGHKAPVYKVAWNPLHTDLFLSCSADWSMILWHQDCQAPLFAFTSTPAVVQDIMWSPKSPFVFAAAKQSRGEVWDLNVSILEPVICWDDASPGGSFTSVLFAPNTQCLLLGDSKGDVRVLQLHNLPVPSSCRKVGCTRSSSAPA
ncbi:WDR78 protein, partial [Bucco capensis]|nr:WDR78 protein [Bucco capensis]